MNDGDRNLNQLLADLYMKEQLIRAKEDAVMMGRSHVLGKKVVYCWMKVV